MAYLSEHAREVIRERGGTVAGYTRFYFPDGTWAGDSCGCPDDRCIGYHHDGAEGCYCLPVTLADYLRSEVAP